MKASTGARILFLLAAIGIACEPANAQRLFTINDLDRVRQPFMVAVSPDGTWISYVLGDTLWLLPSHGGAPRFVSRGMTNQVNYDQPFHAWSPDATRLLYRTGTRGARELGRPMVYDVASGQNTLLLPPQYEDRLQTFLHWMASGPAWSPDGSKVAFLATDTADRSHLGLYQADLSTGAVTLLVRDTTGPIGGVATAAWSPDGRWLAFGTGAFRGDGGRVVLRSADRTQDTVLEHGAPMYRLLSWSPDGKVLSVLRHNDLRILLRIDERGGAHLLSDSVPFTHHAWTPDGRLIGMRRVGMSAALAVWAPGDSTPTALVQGDTLFRLVGTARVGTTTLVAYTRESGEIPLDVWTAELAPGAVQLRSSTRVTSANEWLDSLRVARASIVSWTGPSGDILDALLFLPAAGVAGPQFPLVVRPYGAYRNEFPKSEYFMDAGTQLLAASGWGVVLPNTRGMASHPLTGRYGEVQLEDTQALIDTLVFRGLVDRNRIAVIGHSHGGAMAYYYLTHGPRFCGVIAVNGWSDWSQIAGRLRATEDQLPTKLARFSPILNVDKVSAPLLAVSGADDTQVLPENAARMVQALRELGKPAELLHFEEEGHLLTRSENRRLFWTRAVEFLRESCAP